MTGFSDGPSPNGPGSPTRGYLIQEIAAPDVLYTQHLDDVDLNGAAARHRPVPVLAPAGRFSV